jgi:hypothetical protein
VLNPLVVLGIIDCGPVARLHFEDPFGDLFARDFVSFKGRSGKVNKVTQNGAPSR